MRYRNVIKSYQLRLWTWRLPYTTDLGNRVLRHEGQVILVAPSKKMGKLSLMISDRLGTGGTESETWTDDVGKRSRFMTS